MQTKTEQQDSRPLGKGAPSEGARPPSRCCGSVSGPHPRRTAVSLPVSMCTCLSLSRVAEGCLLRMEEEGLGSSQAASAWTSHHGGHLRPQSGETKGVHFPK